jgi:VIT1/CCC1 family predicted Fe2+/Mn2+ transporter
LDGLITTLTIVLSGKSSNQDTHHILAFGFSSLLGNAVSMAFADFLGSKSDE